MSQVSAVDRQRACDLYLRLLSAWNARRADEFAALFAVDGNTVGFDGSPLDGRERIAGALRDIFASHPTGGYVAKLRELRQIWPGTMLLRAVVGMVAPGTSELNPRVNALQSVVIVDRGDALEIALLHNTPAAFHGRPQAVDALSAELTRVLAAGQTLATD